MEKYKQILVTKMSKDIVVDPEDNHEEFQNRIENSIKKGTKITYRGGNRKPQKEFDESLKNFSPKRTISEKRFRKLFNSEHCFMSVTNENIYPYCKLRFKRYPFLFLEANPVTFYYSIAFDVSQQFLQCHSQMQSILKSDTFFEMKEAKLAQVYSYMFKVNSIAVIFSTMTLEAFANQELPNHNVIEGGIKINKESVEKNMPLSKKLHKIIPKINKVDFASKYPKKMEVIEELINLRHELTHLKKKKGSGITNYEELYQRMLDVDVKKIVSVVKSYINFHYPRLIMNFKIPK